VSEKLGLALADKLIFGKVRLRFGGMLRFTVSGSAALSTEVAEFIDALGIDVYEGYGMTETSPVVSVNYPGKRKIGTVGPPLPGVTVRIDHEATGDEVNGEIIISGPNVMVGYHNRDEENAQIFLPDGSLRSGDMGYLDADGFLVLTGRIKEQYKLENGKYVVPSPLEEELKLSPHILNVMLFGMNKPYNVAVVVLDEQSVRDWAKGQGASLGDPTTNPEVRKLIKAELERYSSSFKGYERPRDFVLTTEDFTSENGMLTPSLKVKRRNVIARYGEALEALYSKS
jgi:long-chain acyl-CoA synthetase